MTLFQVDGMYRSCPTCTAPMIYPPPPGWTIELIREGPEEGPVKTYLTPHAGQCDAPDANPQPGTAIRVPAESLSDLGLGFAPDGSTMWWDHPNMDPAGLRADATAAVIREALRAGRVWVGPVGADPADLSGFTEVGTAADSDMAVGWAVTDVAEGQLVQWADSSDGSRWFKPAVQHEMDGEVFDDAYWANVERHGKTCDNCGRQIGPHEQSSTGWTHTGDWQGIRCPGLLCGATPVTP